MDLGVDKECETPSETPQDLPEWWASLDGENFSVGPFTKEQAISLDVDDFDGYSYGFEEVYDYEIARASSYELSFPFVGEQILEEFITGVADDVSEEASIGLELNQIPESAYVKLSKKLDDVFREWLLEVAPEVKDLKLFTNFTKVERTLNFVEDDT